MPADALTYGKVIGTILTVRADGPDEGNLPDVVGAVNVRPTFTPQTRTIVEPGVALFSKENVVCTVDADGTMLDPEGQPGVWLVTGTYKVGLGGHHPDLTIVVTEGHTAETPLDLSTATDYVPPPGTTVQTVIVPAGAAEGQVLAWGPSGLTWVDQTGGGGDGTQGPPGEDGADGASAYELAVADGFEGTLEDWLASLVGPEGPPGQDGAAGADGSDGAPGEPGQDGADGASAYEVAVAAGFVGTEQDWLDSLVGPQGEPGQDGSDGADGDPGTLFVAGTGVTVSGRLVVVAAEADYPSQVPGGGLAGDIVIALGE